MSETPGKGRQAVGNQMDRLHLLSLWHVETMEKVMETWLTSLFAHLSSGLVTLSKMLKTTWKITRADVAAAKTHHKCIADE